MNVLDDNSRMPFGKYKNEKLANVPASYLLWAYDNLNLRPDLKRYINSVRDSLQQETKRH